MGLGVWLLLHPIRIQSKAEMAEFKRFQLEKGIPQLGHLCWAQSSRPSSRACRTRIWTKSVATPRLSTSGIGSARLEAAGASHGVRGVLPLARMADRRWKFSFARDWQ